MQTVNPTATIRTVPTPAINGFVVYVPTSDGVTQVVPVADVGNTKAWAHEVTWEAYNNLGGDFDLVCAVQPTGEYVYTQQPWQ